ncbi:MAG: LacI family DNA-binding transcriptional regulator [Bacillota bacterium]|jgi:LacI family transcriptional regulator
MPTITDVARKAGVSTSTVSHVINETRYVSDQVKQRVHAAMKDLNYQPNVIARSLRTRETQTVGVVVSDITNPFFTNIVRAIEDEVLKQGYNIILCDTDEKPEREQVYLRLLMGRRVDGLIVAPSSGNADLLQLAIESGYPTVLLDRSIPGLDADVVLSDNEGGAFDAVSYLVGIGHRRIGIIAGRLEVSTGTDRMAGYVRAIKAHGIPVDESLIEVAQFKREIAYEKTREMLARPEPPTALFVCNNAMTAGAMAAVKAAGKKVPKDISVVGFDDSEWAALMDPPLTVVAQPIVELGTRAAQLLMRRISGGRVKTPRAIVLKPELIVRGSCASPR